MPHSLIAEFVDLVLFSHAEFCDASDLSLENLLAGETCLDDMGESTWPKGLGTEWTH